MATRTDSAAIRVRMEVECRPAWLTWVASTLKDITKIQGRKAPDE